MAVKVLVVDDDQWTRQAVVDILRRAGYEVTSLASGEGLEDLLVHSRFAAAIIDYHLPQRNGLEIAQSLRKNLRFNNHSFRCCFLLKAGSFVNKKGLSDNCLS